MGHSDGKERGGVGGDTGLLLLSGAGGKKGLDWLKSEVFYPKLRLSATKMAKIWGFLEEVEHNRNGSKLRFF